ncbi:MAG: type I DNA topoisomerase [Tissierellia bacterium]|nr:type I DNA topoisomerase [Tissierellia bacterium]
MAKNLVVVESPTKAKTIKKMLGSNYKVLATVGHVRDLPKSTLGIDIENNYEPKYINIRGKGDVIKELKKEAKKADNIYLATDPDREGEAISWHLAFLFGLDEHSKNRVVFNEITKNAVKKSIKEPRAIDLDLVDAQQGRRVVDRLMGYKISPLLWKKIKSGLSAGRVQSAVVKLICDREEEIANFIPEEYWTIDADLKNGRKGFNAKYYGVLEGSKEKKVELKNADEADNVEKSIDKDSFVVRDIKEGTRTRKPKAPFTTSTLQQEASKYLNFQSRKTMRVAQELYEGISIGKKGTVGLITYMRTDSVRVSEEAKNEAGKYIVATYGKEYVNLNHSYGTKKNIQDAHECIRPTDIYNSPEAIREHLSSDQYKLYKLIWDKFVTSLMSSAKFETMAVSIHSNDQVFKSTGSRVLFDGFLVLKRKGDELDSEQDLPKFEIGQNTKFVKLNKEQHFTKPIARFTEASLIKQLEELGIGRPSTYAPTISTILARNYVEREDKRFIPTELGQTVNSLLNQYFGELINEEFTAQMEDSLDAVEAGELEWKKAVDDFYKILEKDLIVAEKEIEKIEIRDEETDIICDKCGRNMVIKMGKFGKFLACPGFPECRNTMPLIEKIGVKCPKCDGEIIVKRTKKGRVFYGCSNYPECDFVSWQKPVDKACPECESIMTEVNNRRGKLLKCSNSECGYNEKVE